VLGGEADEVRSGFLKFLEYDFVRGFGDFAIHQRSREPLWRELEFGRAAYNPNLPSPKRHFVIEVRPPPSQAVLYPYRFSGDDGHKPHVSVTEPGQPLNTCSETQRPRTPTLVRKPLIKWQIQVLDLTGTEDQSTLQFRFELHPRLTVRTLAFVATAVYDAVRE